MQYLPRSLRSSESTTTLEQLTIIGASARTYQSWIAEQNRSRPGRLVGQFFEDIIQDSYSALLLAGDLVVDGGANHGLHTWLLSDLVGVDRATILDQSEPDALAYLTFPKEHLAMLHSTDPIERLNGEIKRRTKVVGIFSNDDATSRLVGSVLLERNDEWAVQRARYMTLETISQMSDDTVVILPAVAS